MLPKNTHSGSALNSCIHFGTFFSSNCINWMATVATYGYNYSCRREYKERQQTILKLLFAKQNVPFRIDETHSEKWMRKNCHRSNEINVCACAQNWHEINFYDGRYTIELTRQDLHCSRSPMCDVCFTWFCIQRDAKYRYILHQY